MHSITKLLLITSIASTAFCMEHDHGKQVMYLQGTLEKFRHLFLTPAEQLTLSGVPEDQQTPKRKVELKGVILDVLQAITLTYPTQDNGGVENDNNDAPTVGIDYNLLANLAYIIQSKPTSVSDMKARMSCEEQLFKAIRSLDLKAVRKALNNGADVNAKDEDGWDPLNVAASVGHDPSVRVLLTHGADINSQKNPRGWTPLHFAAANGYATVVRVLLNEANPRAKSKIDGTTPFDVAKTEEIKRIFRRCQDW